MNIQRAKEEIIHTVRAYTARTEEGEFCIPAARQRPILLIGPPGVGKTEIVRQAARICAVGLPVITKQTYQGQEYEVTRYTMSEIIGSIYAYMEQSGKKEGILFLDEINCVSETLMPTMLQLLQGKKFGEFAVPEGWIIVTAGNPYVYNTSVREFDMVTLDRVKRLEIEPDYGVWRAYARENRLHGAILFFLDCKKDRFYFTRREGKRLQFVTARGWEAVRWKSFRHRDILWAVSVFWTEKDGGCLRETAAVRPMCCFCFRIPEHFRSIRMLWKCSGREGMNMI